MTACLQRDPLSSTASKAPQEPLQPEAIVEPAVATLCASHIVLDEAMGITYMDMATTFVEQVALRSSCPVAQTPRLIIEDVPNLT